MVRLKKVDPSSPDVAELLSELHSQCFPELPRFSQFHGDWWIASSQDHGPLAFAGLWPSARVEGAGYLCRAGVLPLARGHSLQRRLIRAREREAKRKGWTVLFSDALATNSASINNLFACGFRAFSPAVRWQGDRSEFVYLRKVIDEGVG
jgi:GNAT superfamily N-acetyltransferase